MWEEMLHYLAHLNVWRSRRFNPFTWKMCLLRRDNGTIVLAGADVNLNNDGGRTALHYAASKGWTRIAKLLISHGAKISMKDKVIIFSFWKFVFLIICTPYTGPVQYALFPWLVAGHAINAGWVLSVASCGQYGETGNVWTLNRRRSRGWFCW